MQRVYPETRALYEDLAGDRLDMSFNNAVGTFPLVQAGRVRALALTTAEYSAAWLGTPTLADSGLPGYALSNWLGFVAPPGTGRGVVVAQDRALVAALRSEPAERALGASDVAVIASSPEIFADHVGRELDRWSWLRG